ncbi:MAG TPA: AMP-binding protein [Vicinamibacterales bacterium]|jgi:long-chain acyl-CoA synthetase|nr:AMP-binding protein [Vicinamibacterales bacterium]
MMRRTLLDFFADVTSDAAAKSAPFLAYDDGYRAWTWTYGELASAARSFAARLRANGVAAGHAVAIWSENRPEWIAALWGALLEGVVIVPIDYRTSADFLLKVAGIVEAKAILVGETVDLAALGETRPIWKLQEVVRANSHAPTPNSQVHEAPEITAESTAEIIFTSGATAEPKGVVLTHKNILANIVPIEREMAKYRKYTRPFRPIRFLNLLPLSHMFGQAMATFVPPMLPGVVIFTRSYSPDDVIRQIRDRRVSVLVCVPKILEVLKDHVLRVAPEAAEAPPSGMHWAARWWRYRRIHRLFGFKFWAMVVGAAPLDPELEAFWGRLGFLVVQGYGLTETAPIVTLNHPLHAKRGAVGKPIAGVEIKIAPDGEILVRGENVTRGYYNAPDATREAFEDGWFHTGDIGEMDAEGRLLIRGRKKEMIVTPEGLNVFPEDVERVLNEQPGVLDSAVVGAPVPGSTAERVQAVLRLAPGTEADAVIRAANTRLGDHQRIRASAVWTGAELPRTEGTKKLKRRELRTWLVDQQTGRGAGPVAATFRSRVPQARTVGSVLERFAPGRTIAPSTTIDELGLTSLERVELMMALEEAFQITVDEAAFSGAVTVGDLESMVKPPEWGAATVNSQLPTPSSQGASSAIAYRTSNIVFPSWNRWLPVRAIRRASLPTWILPLGRIFARVTVTGLEHLDGLDGPVIFAANHQSHFDTPVILDALPPRWRYRAAPAMAKEFFNAHFFPERYSRREWFTNSLNYSLAAFFFNAFPLTQGGAGTRQTLRYMGELVEHGYSILIYPEGRRTEEGDIAAFQPGVGMIASRLGVPVVPVRLRGLERILQRHARFPTIGQAQCAFGAPISLSGNDYAALAHQVEQAVRAL